MLDIFFGFYANVLAYDEWKSWCKVVLPPSIYISQHAGALSNKTIKKRFHSSFHRILRIFLFFYDAFQILQVQDFLVYAPRKEAVKISLNNAQKNAKIPCVVEFFDSHLQ